MSTPAASPPVGGAPGSVLAGIHALLPSLQAAERRVAEVFVSRPEWVIECSAQDVADAAGVSRATVVRTAQRLGYSGFPQLRVLLARDVGRAAARAAADEDGPVGVVNGFFRSVADSLDMMTALLSGDDVERAVSVLSDAGRILVAGSGVSAPVAQEAAMRLSAIGHPAEAPADQVDQQIKARLLSPSDACVIVSGTGATTSSLQVAHAARAAGCPVVVVTAFTRSPLAELADVALVVGMPSTSFRDELRTTVRIPQSILVNALVQAIAAHAPAVARQARDQVLEVVGSMLTETPE